MPIIRIPWERIKGNLGDVTALYALTHRQASLLLSISEPLEWQATFRDFEYEFEDWDELQQDVADLQHNLTMPVNLTDLIPYFDEVEELLRALQYTANCCDSNNDITDGDYYTDPVEDGVGDVPQNIIDAGYASGAADWTGFDDYKCMISYLTVDTLESRLRMLAPYVDSAGVIIGGIATIASIVTTIFTGGLSALALGIIAATGSTALLYKLITDGSILEAMADDVEDNRSELACAIYNADGSESGLIALKDKIDELFDVATATILKNMNIGPTLKALYSGRHDQQDLAQAMADQGLDPDDYGPCVCLGNILWDYQYDTDKQGWASTGDVNSVWVTGGYVDFGPGTENVWKNCATETGNAADTRFSGSGAPYPCRYVVLRFRFNSNGGSTFLYEFKFNRVREGGTVDESAVYSSATYGWDTWNEIVIDYGDIQNLRTSAGGWGQLSLRRAQSAAAGQRFRLDFTKVY